VLQPGLLSNLNTLEGNFHRPEAASFLRSFADTLNSSDFILIGLDATDDVEKI
jgi:hypothetical protein